MNDKQDRKDVNVNTLFPASLLDKLDEWAWRNRMTRSAALRTLVEMAFSQEQRGDADTQQDPETAEAVLTEAKHAQEKNQALYEALEEAIKEARASSAQHKAMSAQILKHSKSIADIQDTLKNIEQKIDA